MAALTTPIPYSLCPTSFPPPYFLRPVQSLTTTLGVCGGGVCIQRELNAEIDRRLSEWREEQRIKLQEEVAATEEDAVAMEERRQAAQQVFAVHGTAWAWASSSTPQWLRCELWCVGRGDQDFEEEHQLRMTLARSRIKVDVAEALERSETTKRQFKLELLERESTAVCVSVCLCVALHATKPACSCGLVVVVMVAPVGSGGCNGWG